MTKKGILLLNLGGPRNLKEVKPFLYQLFSDPDILIGLSSPLRKLLAFLITQIKGPSSIRSYRSIGGGSPQYHWTKLQAQGLADKLKQNGDLVHISIGMRTCSPSIEEGLDELRNWGAQELVLFPLFPQFSTTTTGSCFKEAERILKKQTWEPKVLKITNWPDHPRYIQLLKKTIDEALERVSPPLHILFSAHSLPLAIVKRGDPYLKDTNRTLNAVTPGLRQPWSLAFQSRNGPIPWVKPYVEDELKRLGALKTKSVIVVPLSFVSDNIETLFELDQYYAKIAHKSGIENYSRTRAFNDDEVFFEVLKDVFTETYTSIKSDKQALGVKKRLGSLWHFYLNFY